MKKIVVTPESKIILVNSEITAANSQMWQGIELWGDKSRSQSGGFSNPFQAAARLTNSVISFAQMGITAWKPGDYAKTGGIIQATDSYFWNNIQDVEIVKYQNFFGPFRTSTNIIGNASHFTKCSFAIGDSYLGLLFNKVPSHRVYLWDIKGVNFYGCTFSNVALTPSIKYRTFSGVYAFDSDFSIESYRECTIFPNCVTIRRGSFNNLSTGVFISNGSLQNFRSVIVYENDFNGCITGVHSQAENNIRIFNSVFNVGTDPWPNCSQYIGTLIKTGSNFVIAQNQFNQPQTSNPAVSCWGTAIIETGPNNNVIRENQFNYLDYANASIGNNRDILNTSAGLQYLCNFHIGCLFDISVSAGRGSNLGIRYFQGDPPVIILGTLLRGSKSDANVFSNNGNLEGDYFNRSGNPIKRYYISQNGFAQQITGNNQVLQEVADEFRECQFYEFGPIIFNRLSGIQRQAVENGYWLNKQAYTSLNYLYSQLMDGGDFTDLTNDIKYDWSDDAWEMRTNLVAKSPNLSEEALMEAAKTGVLPHTLLMEVLLSNPASIKSKEFQSFLLNDIPNPLPLHLAELLSNASEPASLRKSLEERLAVLRFDIEQACNTLTHDYLKDTIPNTDSVVVWQERNPALFAKYQLADYHIANGNPALGLTILDNIPNAYIYARKFPDYHQSFVLLAQIKANLFQEERTFKDLNSNELSALQNLSIGDHEAAVQARNILCFYHNDSNCGYETLPIPNTSTPLLRQNRQDNTKAMGVHISPNPSNKFITISYATEATSHHIQIHDAQGLLVKEINTVESLSFYSINVEDFQEGLYFVSIRSNLGVLATSKFLVQK